MSNTHTPEPWEIGENPHHIDAKGVMVGRMLTVEDAARAKDCVNALQGIPNPVQWVKLANDLTAELDHLPTDKIPGYKVGQSKIGALATLCDEFAVAKKLIEDLWHNANLPDNLKDLYYEAQNFIMRNNQHG